MSYIYLQDQGEVSLAGCFLDINQFAPLNGMTMQEINLSSDKRMGACQGSQFGMTCQHLTENHGKESLTLYAGDFHAKTYHQPDRETDLEPYSESFPRWGIMQDGEFWELTIQDYHITAIGAGLLPTVVKNEGIAFLGGPLRSTETWQNTSRLSHRLIGLWKNFKKREMNARIKQKIACHPIFAEWMMGWPEMWSDSQELEMGKFQAWLHLHSKPYQEYEEA